MKNLNEDLYSRFGLKVDLEKVQNGFKKYIKNLLLDEINPLVYPKSYQDKDILFQKQREILEELCRQMFLDFDDYKNLDFGFGWFLEKEFYNNFKGSFNEYIVRLQILLNTIFNHKIILYELEQLTKKIESYFDDYPILGLKIKMYKTKPPQILPSISKFFDKDINDILGLLDKEKYKNILDNFEEGLKKFIIAKTKNELKNIVNDMLSACDETAKIIFKNNDKGFKHIFDKGEYEKFGLNGNQKELYRNLRDFMDKIKHGSIKNFSRNDIEMIVSVSASFIRYVINFNFQKS